MLAPPPGVVSIWIRPRNCPGFSMVDLLVVLGMVGVLAGVAAPLMSGAFRRSVSMGAGRHIAGQIRSARLAAVTANRPMRVRFNCPAAGQYRVLEVTGDGAIDNDANRCSYPYPDTDPNAAPNLDGPIMYLPDGITFSATQDLQISTAGLITPMTGGTPAQIGVTDGLFARQLTVSTAGRIQGP